MSSTFPPFIQKVLSTLIHDYGFSIRPSQEAMMRMILDTISSEKKYKINLIEAPTGTGKSLGYLIPLLSIPNNKKIIVSTGMISLQEQLFFKDIPLLQKIIGPFTASLAKGRKRYVCPEKLKDNAENYPTIQQWAKNYTSNTWNGQSETLLEPDDVKKKMWPIVSVDSKTCKGDACPSFEVCPYHNAKEEWKNSKVIIINHDLLLSDIKYGGGTFGNPEDIIYVIDEAHHFPGKATGTASIDFHLGVLNDVQKYIDKHLPHYKNDKHYKTLKTEQKTWNDFWASYTKNIQKYKPLFITETLRSVSSPVWKSASSILENVMPWIELHFKNLKNRASEWNHIDECGQLLSKIENMIANETLWEEAFDPKKPPIARWIESDGYNLRGVQEPTIASDFLAKKFFSQAYMVVMTSATMRSIGGFQWFKERCGISGFKPTELVLSSPFDFPKQGTFHVVQHPFDVNKEEYSTYLQNTVHQLLQEGQKGVLVLFTSQKLMNDVYSHIKDIHPNILVQYSMPTQLLVKNHKMNIDLGQRSILMGTMSFMEGLDLPGEYCTRVILTKLPFSAGDSPAEKVLAEWLEVNGRNSFREMILPEAGINFVQACGRLIRRESDHGDFILLDNRVTTKATAYGNALLKLAPTWIRQDWQYNISNKKIEK